MPIEILQDLKIPENIDPQEAISFIGKLMELGSKMLSIIKTIWETLNGWFENLTGYTLIELLKELLNVAVNLLNLIIDFVEKIF